LAYQEPHYWPIRNQTFGLSGTRGSKKSLHWKDYLTYPHPVTRARDLNSLINSVTPYPRLLGGSAPCRLKPTHPAYPLKDRPPAEPKIHTLPLGRHGRRENETRDGTQA
jgi:hypothetical protein